MYKGHPDARHATYPPATYALLYPALRWPFQATRYLFAFASLVAAGLMVHAFVTFARILPGSAWMPILCCGLVPLSGNAMGHTIGVGQLGLFSVSAAFGACLMIVWGGTDRKTQAVASILMAFSLLKPTVSAPYFWLMCFSPGGTVPAILGSLLYAALTLVGSSVQHLSAEVAVKDWLRNGSAFADTGYGTLSGLFSWAGMPELGVRASVTAFVLLGGWLYSHRRCDKWSALGFTALFARMWTWHRPYDDVMVLPALLSLGYVATESTNPAKKAIAAMLALSGTLAYLAPSRYEIQYSLAPLVWVASLAFLGYCMATTVPGRLALHPAAAK